MPVDPVTQAAIVAGGADILGGLFTAKSQKKAAARQMNFQERMSNTAYQRAVNDMRRAGINPIMAAKLGGASTPTGAMAPVPDFGKIGSNVVQASNAISQAKLSKANADLAKQDFDTLKSRGLSKSILAGNPFNLLINAAMNNLSKLDQQKAIKGLLELVGVKIGHADPNSAKDKSVKYDRLKKLVHEMEINKKNIKKYYDPKHHKYKDEYLYPDRILRKF